MGQATATACLTAVFGATLGDELAPAVVDWSANHGVSCWVMGRHVGSPFFFFLSFFFVTSAGRAAGRRPALGGDPGHALSGSGFFFFFLHDHSSAR